MTKLTYSAPSSKVGQSFRGCNFLKGADLSGANLVLANLDGANLVGAKLDGADLSGASLRSADCTGASFANAAV